ncbi:Ig-like domain-containing protein [Marinobacter sp. BGYM27]|uniref:Ig-like domain-containing protein n=1 Tax=Marinobacter sp. BGYM27 TaxID=2975597 RepID=UPI0021A84419|nr:Ig-like domain-containing protein [Marinobacter sp. BGYM27]MDG5499607.1 Ig-like domain-containing protein [Marinobacter sp. BGYM27]
MRVNLLYGATVLAFSAFLTGCNDGGSDSASAVTSTASIIGTTPADGARNVDRTTTVSVSFDGDILGTSVTDSSLTLAAAQGAIEGNVSFDGLNNVATFTPNAKLPLLSTVTATASASIADLLGNAMGADYKWLFTTKDGQWGTSVSIANGASSFDAQQVAVDAAGNALVVWVQSSSIYFSRYSAASSTWDGASLLETSTEIAGVPQVAFDGTGNALVVWAQSDGTANSIYSNRYSAADDTWGGATLIEHSDEYATRPTVAFDADDNAVVMWVQSNGTYKGLYASRYIDIDDLWGTPSLVSNTNVNVNDDDPSDLAVAANGDAVAVWSESGDLYANRYTVATKSWGTPVSLENLSTSVYEGQAAIDASGNILVVWGQRFNSVNRVYANRYSAAKEMWSGEILLDEADFFADNPDVAIDPSGNALVVWFQANAPTVVSVFAKRYTIADDSWSGAVEIETSSVDAFLPQVAMDANGNALAVWSEEDGSGNTTIHANRYASASASWGSDILIQSDSESGENPRLAVGANGEAMAVWQQYGSSRGISANHFD